MRLRVIALALVASLLCCCATASAATLHVTSEEEGPGSLGETILEAGPGDTIEIPPGTYLLENGDTMIAQHNILRGAGVEQTTVIPSGGGDALNQISYSGLTVGPARQASTTGGSQIETQAQIIALIATLAIFGLILELVRRRRLVERYALLWMAAAVILLVLAIWSDGLDVLADAMGIKEPANAIFILAFGVIFLLLLNFSVVPLRVSSVLGLMFSVVGFLGSIWVFFEALITKTPTGWGS